MFQDKTTTYAEEGTTFHELVEAKLKGDEERIVELHQSPYFNSEMLECATAARDFVNGVMDEALKTTETAVRQLEVRLDLTAYVPDGFGTVDCAIIADDLMTVIDYKYGKGVEVSAVRNKQMMLYALGALDLYGWEYDIRRVNLVIFQPRLNNVSQWECTPEELKTFGGYVRTRAHDAFLGTGEFVPGDHCRFCKAKPRCRAFRDFATGAWTSGDPGILSDDELAETLSKIPAIKAWATSVETYALGEAMSGKHIPGWKMVEGRSVRKIENENEAIKALRAAGYTAEQILSQPSIKTITELERLMGKAEFKNIVGPYVVKPAGKTTLVPESDKREAVHPEDRFAGCD